MKRKNKKRRYDVGSYVGPSKVSVNNLKVPTLSKELPNELAGGPNVPGKPSSGGVDPTNIIGTATEFGTELLSSIGQRAIDNADPRTNPAIAMKRSNAMNTAGGILGAAGKGAAAGAIAGPVGIAVGAGIGALTAGISKILGAKKQKSDLADATREWASDDLNSYSSAMGRSGYKKGGTITGAGTGKSDSINMKAKDGSFIVPSENAEYGRELGEEYLGWKPGEKASKKEGSVDIMASNSEVIFNPEEVRILKYHGVDIDSLAPQANGGKGNAKGGDVEDPPTVRKKLLSDEELQKRSGYDLASPFINKYRSAVHNVDSLRTTHLDPELLKKAGLTNVEDVPVGVDLDKNEISKALKTDEGRKMYDRDIRFLSETNTKYLKNSSSKAAGANESEDLNLADQAYGTKVANFKWNNIMFPMMDEINGKKETVGYRSVYDEKVKAPASIAKRKYATAGPVVDPVKKKPSMTGALVNYMNNPVQEGSTMTTSDANNVPVTRKQRNQESLTKFSNDPDNIRTIMGVGAMTGSISGMMNKIDVIESIANSPRIARLGKAAQDFLRKEAPRMNKDEFAKLAEDAGHTSLGKYWTTSPSSVSKLYKRGGNVLKKRYAKAGEVIDPIERAEAIKKANISNLSNLSVAPVLDMQSEPGSTLIEPKMKKNTFIGNPNDIGFAEIASAIQMAGGAFGLATAKKAPDIGVSERLRNLSSDVRKQAAYGLDPDQLNVLNNSVERSRRDTNRFITESGGSGQETMAKLNTTLGTTIAGKGDIAFSDAAEKARKFSNVIDVESNIASQEFDVKKMRREDWYKNQEMFASLLSTGIENIIGARQFKSYQKTLSEIDNRPAINFNKS